MEISELFDKKTLEAITADASEAGISADEVQKVLGILTNEEKAPTRSANTQGELMSLLSDDKDDITADVADAAGVERGKTGTILMLAAPFLLKYLLGSSGSNQSAGTSLLGSLLGGGSSHSNSLGTLGTMAALMSLMGGSQQQSSQSSLLGSLLGASAQPTYANNSTSSLLGSLLGAGTTQQQNNMGSLLNLMGSAAQPQQAAQQNNMGSLLNLMGGTTAQTQQTAQASNAGGGILNALFNLLGDNG